jgi:spore maturation protein CgeB
MTGLKIFIVGTINNFCLETSYSSAASSLGYQVVRFDPSYELSKYVKLGRLGHIANSFLGVEVWSKKMNRELIIKVKEARPEVLMIIGGTKIYYGTITTIKAILPACKVVWVWPDTPLNLTVNNFTSASVVDLSATYSNATLSAFQSLGFKNVHWVPLAGDLSMHWKEANQGNGFNCDISFVGMWRPEREKIMKIINEHFGHLKIEIHGSYWKRNCGDKQLLKKWKGNGFFAQALSTHFNSSRINVNIIDDTNYPAANMRFFEIPTSGGLQLCSTCPEFESEFLDKKNIVYFENEDALVTKINWIMNNSQEAIEIRKSSQLKIKQTHNYTQRLQTILSLINLQANTDR